MTDSAAMAFVSLVEKTGPAVWTALDGENRAAFEEDFRIALAELHTEMTRQGECATR